ncbi:unnamed protein product [Pleuronectes platessa]|uniref:Uncharacterized protein n=1 Tax=Pleuronectes platessa TaxID=8262 RepID=A0A9N7YA50_PLEPL|nr:unnamed protein product [Pleuronectes platessa]
MDDQKQLYPVFGFIPLLPKRSQIRARDHCNFSITFRPRFQLRPIPSARRRPPDLRREGADTDSYPQHFIQGKRGIPRQLAQFHPSSVVVKERKKSPEHHKLWHLSPMHREALCPPPSISPATSIKPARGKQNDKLSGL